MKFLTLFLCGAVLASVGCKNYDDDITDLNNKIDGLDKGIVELNKLQDRVTAVEKTAAEFKAMDFSQYVTDTELATKLTEIQNAFNTKLQGYVTTGQLNDAKSALTALINAKCTLDQVKALLVDYIKKSDVYTKAQIDQMIADINLQFTNLQNNTNDWLGPHFATYMTTYVTGEEFKGAVSAAILAQLTSANQTFVDAIQNLMNGDDAVLRQSDLDEIKGGYDDEIDKIWLAIGNLASRIQSLVFVPTTSVGGGAIMYGPQMAGTIALTSSAKAEVTFRVTPASLATSLVDAFKVGKVMISFKDEEVTRAAVEPKIEILNVAAGADGKIVLLTSTDYDFATNGKDLAIALNIADVPAEGETMQGIEFSSAYVFAKPSTSTDVIGNFVLAKANADATGFVDFATSADYELPFNAPATQVVTLLGEYSLMYKSGADYMTIAEAAALLNWDVTPTMAIVNGTPVLSTQPAFTTANYTITPTAVNNSKVNVKVAVKTIDPIGGQIGATYTVPTTVNLTDGVTTELIGVASSVLTITKATLAEVTNANATINWNYAKYAADSYASGDVIIPTGKLTAAQFNAIDWANVAWTVTTPTGSPVVGTVTVVSAKVSTPTTDNDAQIINYTIAGYKNGTGAVNISADVAIGVTTQVKVSGAVTFNGLPDLAYTIATPAGGAYTIATNNIAMPITTTFNSAMYSALPTGQTFFANAAEFDTFLAMATVGTTTDQAAIPAKNIAAAKVTMSNSNKEMSVYFTKTTVDFNMASSYTYTAPATAALSVMASTETVFKIALSGSATINKANGYFLGQGVGIYTDAAVPYMIAQGKTVTTTPAFTIDNVNLATGYAAVVPSNNTKTIAVIYTLKTTSPTGYNGTLPTISNDVLAWNGCALGVVTVEASMTVDGVTIDAKTFEVKLQQPITFNWAAFTTAAIPVVSDGVATATANMFAIMQPTTPEQTYCRDIFGNVLINATSVETWAANAAAYGLAVTFSEASYTSSGGAVTFDRFSFNQLTGVMTVGASNAPLSGVITAVVKVDFTYKYAEELVGASYAPKKFSNTITVKFQNQ